VPYPPEAQSLPRPAPLAGFWIWPSRQRSHVGAGHPLRSCSVSRRRIFFGIGLSPTTCLDCAPMFSVLRQQDRQLRPTIGLRLDRALYSNAKMRRQSFFRLMNRPALLLRLLMELGGKSADLAVGQALGRAVGVLARGVVAQHQHLQPGAGTGAGPFTGASPWPARPRSCRGGGTDGSSSDAALRRLRRPAHEGALHKPTVRPY
jgi:hypothetical protein